MNGLLIALCVVGVLCAWLAIGLLVAVPIGRMIRGPRRASEQPALRTTELGKLTGVLALVVLVAISVALATRGGFVTWTGFVAVAA